MKTPKKTDKTGDLRKQAEKKLSTQLERLQKLSAKGTHDLVQELGTHQIELEMQVEELRRTQEELEASRGKYSDLYDHSPVGYVTFDTIGLIREVNLTAASMLGVERRNLVDKPFSGFVGKGERDAFRAHCSDVLENRTRQTVEIVLKRRDNAEFFARLESIAVEDVEGNAVALRTAVSDITERRKAEKALRESEHAHRTLAENIPDIVYRVDLQQCATQFFNDRIVDITGYRPAELRKGSICSLDPHIVDEDRQRVIDTIRQAIRDRRPFEVEYRFRHKDGSIIYLLERSTVVSDGTGTAAFVDGVIRDITQRKRAEETLRASEARYRSLFDNMINGFAVHDIILDDSGRPVDYIFREVNGAFERHTGLKASDITGRRVTEALPGIEKDPADWIGAYGRIALSGGEARFEQYAAPLHKWFAVTVYSPRRGVFATIFEDITERKRAEESLRQNEEQFRRAIQEAPIPVIMHAEDGEVLQVSRSWTELTGYSIEDIRTFDEWTTNVVYGEGADEVRNHLRRIFSSSSSSSSRVDFAIRTKTGVIRHWSFSASIPGQLADGRRYVVGMALDITDRKRSEEELRQSEARQQAIFDNSLATIFVRDLEGRYLFLNRRAAAWMRTMNVDGDVIGKTDREIGLPSDLAEGFAASDQEVVRTGTTRETEEELLQPDGVHSYMEHKFPLRDQEGRIYAVAGVATDITERRDAEKAIRESEEKFFLLFQKAGFGVALATSPAGVFVDVNEAAARMFGYTRTEIIGKDSLALGLHPDPEARTRILAAFAEQGSLHDIEVPMLTKSGEERFFLINIIPLEFGGQKHHIVTLVDITERTQAEEALRQLNEELEHRVAQRTRFYAIRAGVSEAIVHKRDAQQLYDEVCRIIVETAGFRLAWVGLLDEASREVRPVASAGASAYLDGIRIVAADVPEGRGPTGRAIVEDRHVINLDFETAENMAPWRERARQYGIRSSSAFPLHQSGKVIGTLTIYSEQPRFFTADEVVLLVSLTDDVSFAVESLDNERKRLAAEIALRRSAREIEDLYNNAPCGYHSIDKNGRIIRINDTELRWLGCSREEVLGRKITDFYAAASIQKFNETFPRFVKGGSVVNLEFDLVRKDGSVFQVLLNGEAVRDKNGDFLMSRSTMFDVTERKKAEQRSQTTNAFLSLYAQKFDLKAYLQAAVDLVRTWSGCRHAGIRVVNEEKSVSFMACTGYSDEFLACEKELSLERDSCACTRVVLEMPEPQDLPAMTGEGAFIVNDAVRFFADLPPEQRARYRGACVQKGFRSLAVVPIRHRRTVLGALHLADEQADRFSRVNVEYLSQVSMIIGEAVYRFMVEEERKRLAAAVESTADGVVMTRPGDGRIEYVNRAFEQMTGYSKSEIIGRTLHVLDSGRQDDAMFEQMREMIRTRGAWRGRQQSKTKDGTVYLEDVACSVIRDDDGTIRYYVWVRRDVTEQVRFESIAESVNMMDNIGYVFSGVRHEIGNPVNSAKSILTVLEHKLSSMPPERVVDYVKRALAEIGRVEHVLQSLKSYSLYESVRVEAVSVPAFLHDICDLVITDLQEKEIELAVHVAPDADIVRADPRALKQVLLNLITNAVDALAGRASPRIDITADRERGRVRLRVADNGKGMNEKQQRDLFKPFFTSKPQGTGLGLVIVKKMIVQMNGDLSITSTLGEGTDVLITLEGEEDVRAQPKNAFGH